MRLIACIRMQARRLVAARVVFGHGTINAFDEAAWLALWALRYPIDGLDAVAHTELTHAQQSAVARLVDQRIATRKPAAYLTQEAWLQGVPFYVDERTIVPRSFIAPLLREGSIEPWLRHHPRRILDICTGSACLAILAAMVYPQASITATDISAQALQVAQINLQKHQMQHRIGLVHSDALEHVHGHFDLLLCNPPYVNARSMARLPPEYRAEPHLALAGGTHGMDFIGRLLTQVARVMHEDAVLVLEVGNERGHFEAAFPHLQPVWLRTHAGADQVLLLGRAQLCQGLTDVAARSAL